MAEIIYNFLQSAPRMPWAILTISALAVIIAVVLVVYFLRRLKSTEKEAEDEWSTSHSLFGAATPVKTAERKAVEVTPLADREKPEAPKPVAPPAPPTPIVQPAAVSAEPRQPESEHPPAAPTVPQPAMPVHETPPRTEVPLLSVSTQILGSPQPSAPPPAAAPPAEPSRPEPPAGSVAPSPFGDEVWAELEALQGETVDEWATNDQYEPPRIELIAQPQSNAAAVPASPAAPVAKTVQPRDVPPPRDRDRSAVERPPSTRAAFAPPGIDRPASVETAAQRSQAAKSGSSVLGLAGVATSGPLILGEPSRHPGESGIDSLSNYGKEPDEPKSHGGTYALVGVILIFLIGFGAYEFVPPIHAKLKPYVDRLRGNPADQPVDLPKAQVFPGRYDNTKTPTLIKGDVQNLSDSEALPDLAVTFSLKRHDGQTETRSIPVTPNPLPAGQAGKYEFEMDLKEFASFRPTGLTTTGGKELKFSTPKQP